MFNRSMMKTRYLAFTSFFILLTAGAVFAGGFQISVEPAASANDPQLKGAVLVVRTYGCHQPDNAKLSGRAEGMVNGNRQSIEIQLTPTSKGVYAIKQEWPSEGAWVLAITGEYNGLTSSALVELGPNGKVQVAAGKKLPVRILGRKLTAAEIDTALRAVSNGVAWAPQPDGEADAASGPAGRLILAGGGALLYLAGFVAFTRRRAM